MEFTAKELDLARRAAKFVDNWCIPFEVEAERAGGPLPAERVAQIKAAALEAGLQGGLHRKERGGNSWTYVEWLLVEEQLGRSTNAISWYIPNAYNVWRSASDELQKKWLEPALRGELHDAYAVTEEFAGSDPTGMRTVARRVDGGWEISGEKWFVTFGGIAAVIIVVAYALEPGEELDDPATPRRTTLFAVPADAVGISTIDDPPFTHNYADGHPTMRFANVFVSDADVIGGVGEGDELQRAWFTEERIGIAVRCGGAMIRLLTEAMEWTTGREQGGARLIDHQGVSFPIADSAADAAAGRLLTFEVGRLADAGADPKLVHGKASMAKLFMSEAANRCADRVLQIFGGRGYVRTTAAERLWRELRVDRIWEGSSEIQRLIVARSLERRGVDAMLF
ncbi:MAG: acyl-CoA dehydrogenase family protein [Thermoleophilia bacterium]